MAGKFDIKFKNRFYKILKMYNVSDYLSPKQIKDIETIILRSYNDGQRFYHTLEHINECLDIFIKVRGMCNHPLNVFFAILFHDIVYVPGASDNEVKSAQLMWEYCEKFDCIDAIAVYNYIELTKEHKIGHDHDWKIFRDIDMAILGANGRRCMAYDNALQFEYFHYIEVFPEKRVEFLESIDLENIYATEYFDNRYGEKARRNVKLLINHYKDVIDRREKN